MKYFLAPNGRMIPIPKGRIMAFGFTPEEILAIENSMPSDEYLVYDATIVEDVIALDYETLLVKSDAITSRDRDTIIDWYTELNNCYNESIFWLGDPKPPSHLRCRFYCYENFQELVCTLPEKLLKSHQRVRKSRGFSKNLADCLQILSLIRLNPGIKTKELSEKLELPVRTIQRYITTLQATGEWIDYDTKKRGWQLQYGISILFGDDLKDID